MLSQDKGRAFSEKHRRCITKRSCACIFAAVLLSCPVEGREHSLTQNDKWLDFAIRIQSIAQAGTLNAPVLYVNSVCLDRPAVREAARGGAALLENGSIKAELPAGREGLLIVEA